MATLHVQGHCEVWVLLTGCHLFRIDLELLPGLVAYWLVLVYRIKGRWLLLRVVHSALEHHVRSSHKAVSVCLNHGSCHVKTWHAPLLWPLFNIAAQRGLVWLVEPRWMNRFPLGTLLARSQVIAVFQGLILLVYYLHLHLVWLYTVSRWDIALLWPEACWTLRVLQDAWRYHLDSIRRVYPSQLWLRSITLCWLTLVAELRVTSFQGFQIHDLSIRHPTAFSVWGQAVYTSVRPLGPEAILIPLPRARITWREYFYKATEVNNLLKLTLELTPERTILGFLGLNNVSKVGFCTRLNINTGNLHLRLFLLLNRLVFLETKLLFLAPHPYQVHVGLHEVLDRFLRLFRWL